MSRYEFSLRQEVLMEKGASVLGDLFRHERERGQTGSARVMYDLVWSAKQDVLLAVTEGELNRIEGQFDLARRFLAGIEAGRRMCERGADTADILDRELALILRRAHRKERPRAIFLAGQPGAGKTTLSAMILRQLEGDAALINGDDYRRYHPNSRDLFAGPGSDSVALTAAFSSAVTEGLIARLSDTGRNLVVEGTGRTVEIPRSTAELLAGKGYTAELAVIAARPEASLAGTLLRFHRMREGGTDPRPTPLAAHDNVVRALPGNLDVFARHSRNLPCPYLGSGADAPV